MEVIIKETYEEMSRAAAEAVANLINSKPNAVLGLATGSTPLGLYQELVRMHKDEGLDFSQVTTLQPGRVRGPDQGPSAELPLLHAREPLQAHQHPPAEHPHSLGHHRPTIGPSARGTSGGSRRCGGIDLQILGIGSDGHIAFNEPASSLGSRTRIKTLAEQTIEDNARFFDHIEDVPIYAITMGVGTILEARQDPASGQRRKQGRGGGSRHRGPGHEHDHRQRPAASPGYGVLPRPPRGGQAEDGRVLRVDSGQAARCPGDGVRGEGVRS